MVPTKIFRLTSELHPIHCTTHTDNRSKKSYSPMQKVKSLIIYSLPLALGVLLSYLFWRQNLLLLATYCVITATIVFLGKDKKTELLIFLYGVVAGFFIEIVGTQISGYQSFAQPDVWGIPLWLIVSWGYGFILMKRLGLIIATGTPWGSFRKLFFAKLRDFFTRHA